MKSLVFFYIISIFMIANDGLFTWLGIRVGCPMWRQIIWFIGIIILLYLIRKEKKGLKEQIHICKKYLGIFVLVVFLSILTLLVYHFNYIRIIYAWWGYFCGLPFIVFPYVWCRAGYSFSSFNKLFIALGTFLSLGIIIDYLLGGLFTITFQLAISEGGFEVDAGRYCFLASAPTVFTVYYCFCLFCCHIELSNSNRLISKLFLLFLSVLFVFGSLFCGSRQTFVSLLLVEFLGFFFYVRNDYRFVFLFLLLTGILYFLLPSAKEMIMNNSSFESRYTANALQEDSRSETWNEGVDHCIKDASLKTLLIGDGISYVSGQKAMQGEIVGKHYENTFFARVSDMGWILALVSLLYPVCYFWKKKNRLKGQALMYLSVFLSYIFICMISPNGAGDSTQMSLFILLGLFIINISPKQSMNY